MSFKVLLIKVCKFTKSHSQLQHPTQESGDRVCDLSDHNFKLKSDRQDHMKESHFIGYNSLIIRPGMYYTRIRIGMYKILNVQQVEKINGPTMNINFS